MKVKIFSIYKDYTNLKRNSKREIEKTIKNNVKRTSDGYAGFRTISYLVDYAWQKEADVSDLKAVTKILNKSDIKKRTLILLKKCNHILSTSQVNVFIFPYSKTARNRKVSNDLRGVTAYTPWARNFLLFLHPQRGWKKYFDMTITHEYNHSVRMQYFNPYSKERTILDHIILEGMADNFVKRITGIIPTWAKPFSNKVEKKILAKIKGKVLRKDSYYNFHEKMGIMFGNRKFPHWTGYRIGYSIVNSFLLKNPEISFEKLVKMGSLKILKGSSYWKSLL